MPTTHSLEAVYTSPEIGEEKGFYLFLILLRSNDGLSSVMSES